MSDFVYDHTGRKFLKCAQLMDESTFGVLSETAESARKATDAVASEPVAQPKQPARAPTANHVKLFDK